MRTIFAFFLIAWIAPVVLFAQVPVLEKEPVIWLSADRCGDSAGVWLDLSGNGYHGVFQSQKLPDTVLFNYNRAFLLDISEPGFTIGYNPGSKATITVFTVYQSADTAMEQAVWHLSIDSVATAGLTTRRMITAMRPIVYSSATTVLPVINTMLQNWRVRSHDTVPRSVVLAGCDTLGFTGRLAEFILFDGVLPREQFVRIHTYLAVKYGITLHEMPYVNGNNDIVWDHRANSNWHHNVAAIARDTLLGLFQPQGSAMGGTAPLTIAAGTLTPEVDHSNTLLQHGNFLIWGDNNAALTATLPDTTAGAPAVVPFLLCRRWLMQHSGPNPHLIPTQIVFPGMLPDSSVVLTMVTDTTGSGLFHPDSVVIYAPDSTDAEGNIYFNNIFWGSGHTDEVFTFQAFGQSTFYMSAQQTSTPGGEGHDSSWQDDERMRCTLFPNPTPGHFSLIIALPEEEQVAVTVYDQAGREVYRNVMPAAVVHHHRGELPHKGIFMINVATQAEKRTLKLIVN